MEPGERVEGGKLVGIYRKLAGDDFLPDPMSHEAMVHLAGRPLPADSLLIEQTTERHERRLEEAVEAFASEFFAIPVEARVERWKGLMESCAGQAWLVQRLAELKPGLKVEPADHADTLPAASRLIADLLAIFPLRQPDRGAEARSRACRFLEDRSLSASDRSKGVKRVIRKHPAIAELSTGYMEAVARPWRPLPPHGLRARVSRSIQLTVDERTRKTLLWAGFVVMVGLSRLVQDPREMGTKGVSPPVSPVARSPVSRPMPDGLGPPVASRSIRDELRVKIRRELEKVGRTIDDRAMDKLLDGLPFEVIPRSSGLYALILRGYWTPKVRARFVSGLKERLEGMDLGLSAPEIDALASASFPEAAQDPLSVRRPSP